MRDELWLRCGMVLLVGLCWSSEALSEAQERPVRAELLADVSAVQPGRPFDVGVLLRLQPPWHVYWINPGDAGLPTMLDLTIPQGFAVGLVRYPVPKQFIQPGDIVGYGYEDEVMLIVTVTPPAHLSADGQVQIGAKASWLSCARICMPGQAHLTLQLPVSSGAQPANQEVFARWRRRMPVEASASADVQQVQAGAQAPGAGRIDLMWRSKPDDVQWFPAPAESLAVKETRLSDVAGKTQITFTTELLPSQTPRPTTLPSLVAYTDSDGERKGVVVDVPLAAPKLK